MGDALLVWRFSPFHRELCGLADAGQVYRAGIVHDAAQVRVRAGDDCAKGDALIAGAG